MRARGRDYAHVPSTFVSQCVELPTYRLSNIPFTDARLPSIPSNSAITESATISFVADPTHSTAKSCLPTALMSTDCIICATQGQKKSVTRLHRAAVENIILTIQSSRTLMMGTPSASRPSSIRPYMPRKCHRTRSQVTPIVIRCRCMMTLVDRPVKSRKSGGARSV